jgi:hypothetical protein
VIINHTANTGFGLTIGNTLKFSLVVYSPGGSAANSFSIFNDSISQSALFIQGNNNNIGINTATDGGYKFDVNGTGRFQNILTLGIAANNSRQNAIMGTLNFQSIALNNGAIYDNLYYNGTSWTRSSTGWGFGFQFFNGQMLLNGVASGTGTYTQNMKFKFDYDGYFAIGDNISGNVGNYTGSTALFTKNGRLLLGTTTESTYILDINGTTALRGSAIMTTGTFTFTAGVDLAFATTTGTKIGTATNQRIGFWNATPITRPATGGTSATFVSSGTTNVTVDSTFDGYTVGQVIRALREMGLLA